MITKKNLPFFNVAANSVASLELPVGMTYNRIILQLAGTTFTKAHITRIVAKLNGKMFYEITGTLLDTINKYKGIHDDAAYLTIDFTEPRAKTVGGMYGGAIGTMEGVRSFTLEVTIGAATAPQLSSWSQITSPRPLGLICGFKNHPQTFSAGGKFPLVLPHGPGAAHLIKRVHFFHTNMTELEVKKNGIQIFEEMPTAVNEFIQQEYELVPQSGLYVFDPILTGDTKSVLSTSNAKTLEFNVTISGADTVNTYVEQVGLLSQF